MTIFDILFWGLVIFLAPVWVPATIRFLRGLPHFVWALVDPSIRSRRITVDEYLARSRDPVDDDKFRGRP